MSVMVSSVRRQQAVVTGFIGLLLGIALGTGLGWAIMSAAEQPTAGASAIRGTALSGTQVPDALREFGYLI